MDRAGRSVAHFSDGHFHANLTEFLFKHQGHELWFGEDQKHPHFGRYAMPYDDTDEDEYDDEAQVIEAITKAIKSRLDSLVNEVKHICDHRQ